MKCEEVVGAAKDSFEDNDHLPYVPHPERCN